MRKGSLVMNTINVGRTDVRTYGRTVVRTYASSTVSQHFGAETKIVYRKFLVTEVFVC